MKNIKKISFFVLIVILSTTITTPKSALLQEFEKIKTDASDAITEGVKEVKSEWDEIINYLEKSLHHAKTAKIAHSSLEQHNETAEAVKEKMGKNKKISGKTKKKLSDYNSVADKADDKAEAHRRKIHHLAEKLHDEIKKTAEDAKDGHEKTVQHHDEAQKSLGEEDKKINAEQKKTNK